MKQTTNQLSSQAQCAKEIRQELKQQFKATKFSVTSESFAGGDAVRINWTDGPTSKEVAKITDKYQYGHFDGMIDCYEYSNNRKDIAQAKFVQTQRDMSEEAQQKIIKKHNEMFCEEGQINDLNEWNEDANCWNNSLVYRKFAETSY